MTCTLSDHAARLVVKSASEIIIMVLTRPHLDIAWGTYTFPQLCLLLNVRG
jgi:hypothetical protein